MVGRRNGWVGVCVPFVLYSATCWAWHRCDPDDPDSSLCPDANLCCSAPDGASFTCLTGDRGSADVSTCCDDGLTGCGKGFVCSDGDGTANSSAKTTTCVATNPEADELPDVVPRTRLCTVTPNMTHVYGLPMMDYPLALQQRGLRAMLSVDQLSPVAAYLSSHGPIHGNVQLSSVTRAIVLIHGSRRNVEDYMCCASAAAALAASIMDPSSVLLLAPWFLAPEDGPVQLTTPDSNNTTSWPPKQPSIFRWAVRDESQQHTWRYGALSVVQHSTDARVSSFTVVDRLVQLHLQDRRKFPALRHIVVAGHSAGGQFVQRWALLSPAVPPHTVASTRVPVRCVVANPKSFAYLDARRWMAKDDGETLVFRQPDESLVNPTCPSYNEWLNGLDESREVPVPYLTRALVESGGVDQIVARYAQRDVVYLSGEQDVTDNGDCAAFVQGPNRFIRSQLFFESLSHVYNGANQSSSHVHRRWVVPQVHHDHCLMFQSIPGQQALLVPDG